jgi:serine/threonine protein kinase
MDKKGLKLGGKYKIGKKLGAGAFGEVYLGKSLILLIFYRLISLGLNPKLSKIHIFSRIQNQLFKVV